MLPVPLCTILQESNYISTSNIDFANLLDAYKRYPMSPALFEIANASMLRMISAYDKAPQPRKNVLLRTAYQFAEWLMEDKDSSWDSRIAKINYYQIVRRERELTIDEIDDIRTLLMNHLTERTYLLVAIFYLVDIVK